MGTEAFFTFRSTIRRVHEGPLGPYVDDYAAQVLAQGYCRKAGRSQLRCVAEFSRWLERRKLSAEDIDGATIDRFLSAYHRRRRRACQGDLATLRRLRRLLIERGVVSDNGPPQPMGTVSLIERDFDHYLTEERGLSSSTRDIYHDFVHQFLDERFDKGAIRLEGLSAAEVTDFVQHHARDFGSARVRLLPTALRAFLRYLLHRGAITQDLSRCVPAVANWSCALLPKSLGPGEVEQVLKRCTRETPVGRRDYAILLLLARLGLRGGEVAGLTLEDIDWDTGRLRLRSKCKRCDELPLPAEVGEAIADYLAHGRPASTSRRVFVRARAPYSGFSSTCAICDVVDRALTRAGVASTRRGGHLFRHSLASEMLRAGASLTEIGQLLRHRNPDTTRIYAKVDVAALRRLAIPWPGGGR
jgi:site-specific recombinase XerD